MTALRTRSRVLTVVLALGLMLGLAACGSDSSDSADGGDGGGSEQAENRGANPDSEYCQVVLDNLENDVDGGLAVTEQAPVAPDELADAYEVLTENVDLVDAWDTLDDEQRAPIAQEMVEVVQFQVSECGVDLSMG